MTTEQHAADALRALVREPVELSQDGLRSVLAAIPDTPQQRSPLPQFPAWTLGSMFSAARVLVASAIVALFGGFLLASVLTTQPSDEAVPAATPSGPGSFSPAGSLSEPRSGHEATRLPDGRVVVVGGVGPGTGVEVWDPETASFAAAGMLTTERGFGHEAALLPDSRVLVVGGWYDTGDEVVVRDTAEVWDPGTETSALAGSLPPARMWGSTTILPDGRVLYVGGEASADPNQRLWDAEIWDPETATSAPAGTLLEARNDHAATVLADGRVLIVGGSGTRSSRFLASAEVWDPATLTFSPAGTLTQGRGGFLGGGRPTATLLSDGRVLVVGGSEYRGGPELASAEVWDPATLTFSPAGSLTQARFGYTASLLPDGRVLVIGGASEGETMSGLDLVEIWDPITESFTPGPSLQQGRSRHTATVLRDGRVLVIGGDAAYDHGLASAEIWEPERWQPEAEAVADADTITPDLLPGVDLVTEEVEPGVYRVVSDGVRDIRLTQREDWEGRWSTLAAGPAGEVWVFGPTEYYRLGSPETHAWSGLSPDPEWFLPASIDDVEIAPDGTVWWSIGNPGYWDLKYHFNDPKDLVYLWRFDGTRWTRMDEGGGVRGVEVLPDGTVLKFSPGWGYWPKEGETYDGTVQRWRGDGWEVLGDTVEVPAAAGHQLLLARSSDDVWLLLDEPHHYDGETWSIASDLPEVASSDPSGHGPWSAIGADGTVWLGRWGGSDDATVEGLARFDGSGWETFPIDEAVQDSSATPFGAQRRVDANGRLWMTGQTDGACHGVTSFDGRAWVSILTDVCVYALDTSPDGHVWLLGETSSPDAAVGDEASGTASPSLYVITPEAVAAAE